MLHELLKKKLIITVLPSDKFSKKRGYTYRTYERPATLGYFTIGDIQYILNRLQLEPFKLLHYFNFPHGRYIVKIYDPANEDEITNTEYAVQPGAVPSKRTLPEGLRKYLRGQNRLL